MPVNSEFSDLKEFEVRVRIRNNLLVQRRESLGLSVQEMADEIGITYSAYLEYENLKRSPISKHVYEKWKSTAERIATYFRVMPEDLWPEVIQAVQKNESRLRVSAEEAYALMGPANNKFLEHSPEELASLSVLAQNVEKLFLEGFTDQEVKCIRWRYGEGLTLREIGDRFGVLTERARQIEAKALRKLRHSKRTRILR